MAAERGASPYSRVTASLSTPRRMARDDTFIYVANYGGGNVVRIPRSGGKLQVIADGAPVQLAVDSTGVYFANEGGAIMAAKPL